MTLLIANQRWTIDLDESKALVRATRTDLPTQSMPETERLYCEVEVALDAIGRRRHVLLVDLRGSPVRNDPEFEQAMARLRLKLFGGFAAVAVLVKTAVGVLQVQRYAREDGVVLHVCHNEEEAYAYFESRPR
jgi:hypothetical protein